MKTTRLPSIVFLVGSLVGGNVVSMLLRMVGGVLQARCVEPAVLGLFNGIGLVLGYAPFLQLGILNGLNRELPFYVGKGDRQRVEALASAAQMWALVLGIGLGLSLLAVACWKLIQGEFQLAAGWAANAILGLSLFYNTLYLQTTYRTSQDFSRLAIAGVIENFAGLLLVSLLLILNFYGLCLRAILMAGISVAFLHYWRPVRVGLHWNLPDLVHLLRIGGPIFVVGQLYSGWMLINSSLVLYILGNKGMGLYSLVVMASSALEFIPSAVSQVIYPRMAERHGRRDTIEDLINISWKPMLITAAGMIPLISVAWILLKPAVRLLAPSYMEAVPSIQWCLLLPFVSSFTPVNSIFPVLGQLGRYAVAILIGMAVYGICLMWLIRERVSLVVFLQSMVVGRIAMILTSLFFITWMIRLDRVRKS